MEIIDTNDPPTRAPHRRNVMFERKYNERRKDAEAALRHALEIRFPEEMMKKKSYADLLTTAASLVSESAPESGQSHVETMEREFPGISQLDPKVNRYVVAALSCSLINLYSLGTDQLINSNLWQRVGPRSPIFQAFSVTLVHGLGGRF
jgi:hypothetical protein